MGDRDARRGSRRAPHCPHPFTVVRARGSRDDAAGQLAAVGADFMGIYVSDVYEVEPGVWGWAICPDCPVG
jgi:hypothetical protein